MWMFVYTGCRCCMSIQQSADGRVAKFQNIPTSQQYKTYLTTLTTKNRHKEPKPATIRHQPGITWSRCFVGHFHGPSPSLFTIPSHHPRTWNHSIQTSEFTCWLEAAPWNMENVGTLLETNISNLRIRKIIGTQLPLKGNMLVSWRVPFEE